MVMRQPSSKPGLLTFNDQGQERLVRLAYMPFVKNGGLFIHRRPAITSLGDEVFMLLNRWTRTRSCRSRAA